MVYIIYQDPKTNYHKVIERFCLRYKKKNGSTTVTTKESMHNAAQHFWKENNFASNERRVSKYLKLKEGEKPFDRYNFLIHFFTYWNSSIQECFSLLTVY